MSEKEGGWDGFSFLGRDAWAGVHVWEDVVMVMVAVMVVDGSW